MKTSNRANKFYRLITSPVRLMPNFMIIGAQKCGTTSLFEYLMQHPCIASPAKKEIGFFSIRFQKGLSWYQSHFPISLIKPGGQDLITGEASTGYIYHPHVPKRVAACLPQVKIIALLRNPVDRAYSHYHHVVRLGIESLSFEAAIEQEAERVSNISARILEDECYYDPKYHHYTYLSRGIYVDQLKAWFDLFPKEQILILKSEDLFAEPSITFKQVLEFLNLPNWELKSYKQYNKDKKFNKATKYNYPEMDIVVRKQLVAYFKPHNQRLYKYLGTNFGWNTGDGNAIHRNETERCFHY